MTFIDSDICYLPALLPVLHSVTVTYFFKVKYFKSQYVKNGESQRKTARDDICRFQYLLWNGIIANVILFHFDLLFQGQTSTVIISKTVKASAKLQKVTFIEFNFCHRIASLRMLYSLALTQCSRSNVSSVNILKTVRASAKA